MKTNELILLFFFSTKKWQIKLSRPNYIILSALVMSIK